MAHISLYSTMFKHSQYQFAPTAMVDGATTILNVRVLGVRHTMWDFGKVEMPGLFRYPAAIMLEDGEADKIKDLLPKGWMIDRVQYIPERPDVDPNTGELVGLRMVDALVMDPCVWVGAIMQAICQPEDLSQVHYLLNSDKHLALRPNDIMELICSSHVDWPYKTFRVTFDINDERDLDAVFTTRTTHQRDYQDSTRHRVMGGLGLYNSKAPWLAVVGPGVSGHGVRVSLRSRLSEISRESIHMSARMDAAYARPRLNAADAALRLYEIAPAHVLNNTAVQPVAEKTAGRRAVVIDDDDTAPPHWPLKTKVTVGSRDWIGLRFDPARFGFSLLPSATEERSRCNMMLVHRHPGIWRFVFVVGFEWRTGILHTHDMALVLPYAVGDDECAREMPDMAMPRGVAFDLKRAIHATPYCASAFSHALNRMRFLFKNRIPDMQYLCERTDQPIDVPGLPILIRNGDSAKIGHYVHGDLAGNRVPGKEFAAGRYKVAGVLRRWADELGENHVPWEDPLIAEFANPVFEERIQRAVVLEM